MADEKAAKSLEVQLRNTGYQFSAPGVEKRGMPNNPPLAFIGWCLKYTKGNSPS